MTTTDHTREVRPVSPIPLATILAMLRDVALILFVIVYVIHTV
jgi:hypothetical protein